MYATKSLETLRYKSLNMGKLLLIIGIVALTTSNMMAQQTPQFSQYMLNSYLINPALAGTEDYIDVKAGYRNQWGGGFDGQAPKTFYVSGHSPIAKPHEYYHAKGEHVSWHGVGGMVISDQTGPTGTNSFYGSYSYNMGITKPKGSGIYKKGGIRASFGLFLGVKQYNIDFSELSTFEDEAIGTNTGDYNQVVPDASIGTWVYGEEWYVGASAMQLLKSSVSFNGVEDATGNSEWGSLDRHYFITGGTRVQMSRFVDWVPSLLIKGVAGAPVSVDINSRFDYDKKYFVGLSYRHNDAFVFMAGATINYLIEIAYSYDHTISDISNFDATGSHEIMVGIRIKPSSHLHNAEHWWK